MDFKIGDVVRLKEDIYYGTDKETDHVRIKELNIDGTFNGIGICKGKYFTNLHPEKWEKTMEK